MCLFFAVWAGGGFFLLFGRVACSCFCCLGGCAFFFFPLFGRGRVLFFAVWAGGVFFFFFLNMFGRGTGVHSLTRLPARL